MLGFSKVLFLAVMVAGAFARGDCPPGPPPSLNSNNAQFEGRIFGRWPVNAARENANTRVFLNGDTLIRVVQFPNRQVVSIFGVIFQRDWELAKIAIDSLEQNKKTVVLTLFGGGTTGTVRSIVQKFREKCPKGACELHTQVLPSSRCASNCITMFMMGDVRLATPTSLFGFHAASIGGERVSGMVEEIYAEAGVSADWLRRNNALFATTEVTYLKPNNLEDSNIVTKYVNVSAPAKPSGPPENMCAD